MSDARHDEILKVGSNISDILSFFRSLARQSFDEVPWLDLGKNGLRFECGIVVAYAIDCFVASLAKPAFTSGRIGRKGSRFENGDLLLHVHGDCSMGSLEYISEICICSERRFLKTHAIVMISPRLSRIYVLQSHAQSRNKELILFVV